MSSIPKPDYYYAFFNADVAARIPRNAQRVLEFGCASGVMAREVLKEAPQIEWWGVEIMKDAAEKARDVLHHVIEGDIETLELTPEKIGTFDCLVYGDVLEHLKDPWLALKKHMPLLSPEGCVVVCLPNIQNWSVMIQLFQGQFRYQSEGIMDETHLRFFTRDTAIDLLTQAGLQITELVGRVYGLDQTVFQKFLELSEPLVRAAGVNVQDFAHQTAVVQWVLVGQKQ